MDLNGDGGCHRRCERNKDEAYPNHHNTQKASHDPSPRLQSLVATPGQLTKLIRGLTLAGSIEGIAFGCNRSPGGPQRAVGGPLVQPSRSVFMLVRACAVLSVVLLVVAPIRADQAAKAGAPIVSVQIRSLHDLVADIGYLAKLAGQEEQATQLEGVVQAVVGGINQKEPIGFYMNDLTSPTSGIIMVPITDQATALKKMAEQGQKPEKDKSGIYTLSLQFPPVTLYFRFANKYAYLCTSSKDPLSGNLPKPTDVFRSQTPALLSASFRIDQIPANLKEFGVSQFEAQLDNAKEMKEPGETAAQHQLKVQMLDDFG